MTSGKRTIINRDRVGQTWRLGGERGVQAYSRHFDPRKNSSVVATRGGEGQGAAETVRPLRKRWQSLG